MDTTATVERRPFTPWPHQKLGFDEGQRNLYERGFRSTILISATGSGKTTLAAMFARQTTVVRNKPVLFVAHRNELIAHAVEDFEAMGIHCALEKASSHARRKIYEAANDLVNARRIMAVVASVQTLKGRRLDNWPRDFFGEVYCDEAHHSLGRPAKATKTNFLGQEVANVNGFRAIADHFHTAKLIGFTATPRRDDGRRVEELYDSVSLNYPMMAAIRDGMLAQIEIRRPPIRIDLKAVKKYGFDLNQGQLEEAVLPFIQPMANALVEEIEDRTFLVFTPGRDDAEQKIRPCQIFAAGINEAMGRADNPACYAIWGEHPDRESLIEGFKAGRIQGLVNADLLCEGFDNRRIEAIGMCRATTSNTLYEQMIGRGLRLCPETFKKSCKVIDFDWGFNVDRLSSIYTILSPDGPKDGARFAEDVVNEGVLTDAVEIAEEVERRSKAVAEAEARRKHQEELDARSAEEKKKAREKAVEEAKRRALEKATREEEERNRLALRAVELGVVREATNMEFLGYDPFSSALSISGLADRPWGNTTLKASQRQVMVLAEYGIPEYESRAYSREMATEMQTLLWQRHIRQMARIDQIRDLMAIGYGREDAWSMTRREARACIRDHEQRNKRA